MIRICKHFFIVIFSLIIFCSCADSRSQDSALIIAADSTDAPALQIIPLQTDAYQYAPTDFSETADGYYGDVLSYNGGSYRWDMCIYDMCLGKDLNLLSEPDNEAAKALCAADTVYLGECGTVATYAFEWNCAECMLLSDGRILAIWENRDDYSKATHFGAFFSIAN